MDNEKTREYMEVAAVMALDLSILKDIVLTQGLSHEELKEQVLYTIAEAERLQTDTEYRKLRGSGLVALAGMMGQVPDLGGADNSIWCVTAAAGEWSDKYEWIVCWLATEAEAMEFKDLCQAAGDKAEIEYSEAERKAWDEYHAGTLDDDALSDRMDALRAKPLNEYDKGFDSSGTYYRVEKVSKAIWKAAVKC